MKFSLRGLVYIQFSCKYVGKEYGINNEANSDSNFLAAGGCFFHSGTPWQLDFIQRFFLSIFITPN
jgi:hypothetical protein